DLSRLVQDVNVIGILRQELLRPLIGFGLLTPLKKASLEAEADNAAQLHIRVGGELPPQSGYSVFAAVERGQAQRQEGLGNLQRGVLLQGKLEGFDGLGILAVGVVSQAQVGARFAQVWIGFKRAGQMLLRGAEVAALERVDSLPDLGLDRGWWLLALDAGVEQEDAAQDQPVWLISPLHAHHSTVETCDSAPVLGQKKQKGWRLKLRQPL